MPAKSVSVTKSKPGLVAMYRSLQKLNKSEVFVGIPADNDPRNNDDEITNAELMFIQSRGSPLNNIPARPVIEPAIEKNRKVISQELAAAAKARFAGSPEQSLKHLNRAGTIAVNAAKRQFTDNDWPPNAPSTIRRKGSDRPLIDTGQLRRSITYVVAEGDSHLSPDAQVKIHNESKGKGEVGDE